MQELLKKQVFIITLVTCVTRIPKIGVLEGQHLATIRKPKIEIWLLKEKKYSLYYSYYSSLNEICYLYFIDVPRSRVTLSEAFKRIKDLYNLPNARMVMI